MSNASRFARRSAGRLRTILVAGMISYFAVLAAARAQGPVDWPDTSVTPSAGLSLAQAGTPQPKGLPPAPSYIPGTAITPAEDPAAAPARRKSGSRAKARAVPSGELLEPKAAEAPASTAPVSAGGQAVAVVEPGDVRTDSDVWRKVTPLLPEPGDFAVIPGSELTPVLVRDGEFDFCDEIKCYRSPAVLGAWNGGAFDQARGEFRLHGGGHADYGGNEVYVFDFATLTWSRESDPQPLTGPFLKDSDGDGVPDVCPAPASGPPATHTYQGFVYVPKIDRYWLFGTVEYCSSGMAGNSAWEYDSESKTWTPLPQLNDYAKFARALIEPRSGNVLLHVGRKHGWHEIDPVKREVVRSFEKDPFGNYIDGPAVFDGVRGIVYTLIQGRSTDRLVAYNWPGPEEAGLEGRLIAEWPKEGKKAWGLAQHASGLLVLWDGNSGIILVDPASGKSWEPEPGGFRYTSPGGGETPGKVYSKWRYIPGLDVFFGITNADLGVVLYRLGGSLAERPRAPSGSETARPTAKAEDPGGDRKDRPSGLPPGPGLAATAAGEGGMAVRQGIGGSVPLEIETSASWEDVCATAVLCDPMGAGDVISRGQVAESGPPQRGKNWRRVGQKFRHPDEELASSDPEVGGLRFKFPSNSRAGAAGNFSANFSPDYSFQVGPETAGAPAQEVYIQFQVRYSCTFIWTDCDPQSPNYRKERRCFLSKRGDGDCTASKVALISTGDRDGSVADACTRIQTAINHGSDHSLQAFHRCPRAEGFGERLPRVGGRYQGDSQPNGLFYCPRVLNDGSLSGWNNTAGTCFRLIDEKWITIQLRLRFGPWQADAKKGDPNLSHVSIWAAVEDEADGRQRLVIDNDFPASSPEAPKDLVGKIWLMPHLYNKTTSESHPPFFVWYRNLVIAEALIPNPQ